jgi:hypothetical protein
VLQHIAGYFKDVLDRESKIELAAAIDDYRRSLVPLIVPITLIRHYVRFHEVPYLAGQIYLQPHPKELMLRKSRLTRTHRPGSLNPLSSSGHRRNSSAQLGHEAQRWRARDTAPAQTAAGK